jgi:DNA-binding transcriptional LysR family regulator
MAIRHGQVQCENQRLLIEILYNAGMYDPRQLQVLVEVARTGTYTAAAEALGYTQPAISYQMHALERAVGVPLTIRSGRGMRLTHAGRTLARHADTVLATLRAAQDELTSLATDGGGQVRLSSMQSGCVALVPAALQALRSTRPKLEVVVTQAECQVSHNLVLAGDVDLAVMCDLELEPTGDQPVLPDPRLRRVPLTTDQRCVLLPADHPAAAAPAVDLADLRDECWVLESSRTRFLTACAVAATRGVNRPAHHPLPGGQSRRAGCHERTRGRRPPRPPGGGPAAAGLAHPSDLRPALAGDATRHRGRLPPPSPAGGDHTPDPSPRTRRPLRRGRRPHRAGEVRLTRAASRRLP